MTSRTSPALLRRKLGTLLRQHREALGLKAAEVAVETDIKAPVISRLETGSRPPGLLYVRELCRHYQLDKETTDRLVRIARASQQNGWWEDFKLNRMTSTYIEFEAGASAVANYENAYIPGLLQTREYGSAVVGEPLDLDKSDKRIGNTTDARQERQRILTGSDPLNFHAIISEAVLLYKPGGNAVHVRQLRHLIKQAALPSVTLQVLPFEAGSGLGLMGPFSVLSFDDDVLADAVYVEGPMFSNLRVEQDYVDRCKEIFAGLADLSADPERSVQIVEQYLLSVEKK